MSTTPKFSGIIKFRVEGQKALPPFQQELNRRFIAMGGEMPEALRYQCRIAQDARANFETVKLDDGEMLSLHPNTGPQFGKNVHGQAYLTATFTYSGDGKTYRVNWTGHAVPDEMMKVAVKHDLGKYVPRKSIPLDLAQADVRPTWKRHGPSRKPGNRDYVDEETRRTKSSAQRNAEAKSRPRHCARYTADDLAA